MYPFRNKTSFYGEELLAPRPKTKPEDHPQSAVCSYPPHRMPFLHPQGLVMSGWQGPTTIAICHCNLHVCKLASLGIKLNTSCSLKTAFDRPNMWEWNFYIFLCSNCSLSTIKCLIFYNSLCCEISWTKIEYIFPLHMSHIRSTNAPFRLHALFRSILPTSKKTRG